MRIISKKIQNTEYQNYLDQYLNNLSRLNKSEHTIKNYNADLEKFFKWLGESKKIPLHKVNGETISLYKDFLMDGTTAIKTDAPKSNILNWLSKAFFIKSKTQKSMLFQRLPLSVSSRRRHLSSIKNFFEYLKQVHEDKSERFIRNPVKNKIHAITLKDVDVVSTKLITKDEFQRTFEKSYRTKERLLLQILYFGGLRLSEICNLKKLDFDYESKSITFIRKGGSRHKLYINEATQIFSNLTFYLSQDEKNNKISPFLFHNKQGEALSLKAMYNLIMSLLKRGEVKREITPHSFRKACATNLYYQTKDLLFVRDYLNHKDAKVTQTYIDTKSTIF